MKDTRKSLERNLLRMNLHVVWRDEEKQCCEMFKKLKFNNFKKYYRTDDEYFRKLLKELKRLSYIAHDEYPSNQVLLRGHFMR